MNLSTSVWESTKHTYNIKEWWGIFNLGLHEIGARGGEQCCMCWGKVVYDIGKSIG